jgi:hypothetical protein
MRFFSKRRNILAGGCILLVLSFIGCSIISKTFTIVIYIEDRIWSTDEQINYDEVSLEDNEDWKEHKDKIKRIDSVEFAVRITNNENTEATGQIYISNDNSLSTPSSIQDSALLVLDGIVIPPGETKVIEREESIGYTRNYEELRDYVKSGFFYVYAIAENIPFNIEVSESLAVIVSFTAEKK